MSGPGTDENSSEFSHQLPRRLPDAKRLSLVREIEPGKMPDADMQMLYAWWKDHVGADTLPRRKDFHPSVLPASALPWIAMLDVERNPLKFRHRLVGTGITEAVGRDATGQYISAPHASVATFYKHIKRLYWLVMTGRPYLVCDRQATWAVKDYRHYDVLALPFASGDKRDEVGLIMFKYYFK